MAKVTITKYSRGFKVTTNDACARQVLSNFNRGLKQPKINKERGRVFVTEGESFYAYDKRYDAYHYSNGIYDELCREFDMYNIGGADVTRVTHTTTEIEPSKGRVVDFSNHTLNLIEPDDSPFVEQNDVIRKAIEKDRDHAILEVQTGRGKTAMGQKIIALRERRAMIITKAAYVDKWKGDLTEKKNSLSLRPGELIVVKGVEAMNDLIEMAKDGDLDSGKGRRVNRVILVSSNTFDLWLKDTLSGGNNIDITKLLELLGVGTLLYDETHQFFRMNYVSFILLNPDYAIDLSATLIPRQTDEFAKKRYAERFPRLSRIEMEYVKYIEAISIYYHTGNKELLRRINRMKMYNHIEFEKFVMKRKPLRGRYFEMIYSLLDKFYVTNYKKGQRALVFFASQHMCTAFVDYLKEKLPSFDIQRNIQGDNYKKFINADIGVSTPGKSGTAVDIPGLIFSVVSVAIGKEDTNLQILGRTRQDRTWGLKPKVIFLHCEEFRKHIDYLKTRIRVFDNRVESFKILNSGYFL